MYLIKNTWLFWTRIAVGYSVSSDLGMATVSFNFPPETIHFTVKNQLQVKY